MGLFSKHRWLLITLFFISEGAGYSQQNGPLEFKDFKTIIDNYSFVGDFSIQRPERAVSEELFWKYPFKIPKMSYPIYFDVTSKEFELPKTYGDGKVFEHMNLGRKLFLEGDYEKAKLSFLSARARFGKNHEYYMRNDYFIALSILKTAQAMLKKANWNYNDPKVKSEMSNATTFLSWGFIKKKPNMEDPAMMVVAPKAYYNLASIYHKYDRWASSYSAVLDGLNFLRAHSLPHYRSKMKRILADIWIRNKSYMAAVQELDTMIREESDKEDIILGFSRVGDIYFDLNNYELAEDIYGLAQGVARTERKLLPAQLILRGEALFWMGQFSMAQKMIRFGLRSRVKKEAFSELPEEYVPWARLRFADAFLARARRAKMAGNKKEAKKLLEKAKLEYFRVGREFPNTEIEKIAKVRSACLELPEYLGNNVKHARSFLQDVAKEPLPAGALELSWACKTMSYAKWQRTPDMLNKVRVFAKKYPDSRFLLDLIEPVKEKQAERFNDYLEGNTPYLAIEFFEKNRQRLFDRIDEEMKSSLFELYVDHFDHKKAQEFYPAYQKAAAEEDQVFKIVVFALERADKARSQKDRRSAYKWSLVAQKNLDKLRQAKLTHSESHETYLSRYLQVAKNDKDLFWAYKQVRHWTEDEKDLRCSTQIPLALELQEKNISARDKQVIGKDLEQLISAEIEDLKKNNQVCFNSLIDFELNHYQKRPDTLAKRWKARFSWPLDKALAARIWLVSEILEEQGLRQEAIEFWQHLADNGPADSNEVKFAKMRLDPSRTVLEKLWH